MTKTASHGLRALGSVFRNLRRDRRLTQWDVARRAGMDAARVSDLERGVTDAQWTSLDRLALALGIRDGALDLIRTHGDAQLRTLLRAWHLLDEDGRADLVRHALHLTLPERPPSVTLAGWR